MHPKLVVFCAYPVTGKTELAAYLEREFGFARVDWDKLTKESEMREPTKAPQGYNFIEEAFRRTLAERDQFLAQNRDVIIDSPATEISSRQRLFTAALPCDKYTIVIDISERFHLALLRKRCPETSFGLEAVYGIREGSWYADPLHDRTHSKIIRLKNSCLFGLRRMKKRLKNELEKSKLFFS